MKLLLIILICTSSALAQNCTTQPAMNTTTMTAAGTMAITGDAVVNTITVTLDNAFTSNTGYITVNGTGSSFAAPGNNGSFKIISGNGTGTNGTVGATKLVLDASFPSRTNGGTTKTGNTAGNYVTDLGVIRNSTRSYTFVWSTPGYNSDTWVSYGDDVDTGVGVVWRSADTVTGVTNHSITVDNLDPFYVNGAPNGLYNFTVWSDCFTGGVPDMSLSVHTPHGGVAPNQATGANGWTKIYTGYPDVTPGLNIFTMDSYNDAPTTSWFQPPQDGSHPGWRTTPGGQIQLPLTFMNTTWPVANASGDNAVNADADDWVPPSGNVGGYFFTFGKNGAAYNGTTTPWTGQNIVARVSGAVLTIYVDPATPTAAPCGNILGAEAIMLDGGTLPACAYPIKVTGSRWWANYGCGTVSTCGPPGTPATPIANIPSVNKVWLIVFSATGVVPTGTVGAWPNPYTMMPGIPCNLTANITVDKPNAVYANPGCVNKDYGPTGIGGNMWTYQGSKPDVNGLPAPPAGQPYGGQEANCAFDGQRSEGSYISSSTPIWFYDSGSVCHALDVQFPPTGGTNNDEFEKHILGIYWEQSTFARAMDPIVFAEYAVTSGITVNKNLQCAAMSSGSSVYCDTITYTVNGDVGAIQSGLAAGQHFRVCVNNAAGGGNYSYACGNFPYSSPSQIANVAAGGTLPPSAPTTCYNNTQGMPVQGTICVFRVYTDANNYGHSVPPNTPAAVTVDSTCPTSGNCSVTVPSPGAVLNATAYDVYARDFSTCTPSGCPTYRQNTAGPIPLGQPFTFGTAANPLLLSGTGLGGPSANIASVVAADNVAHTLTTSSNWASDVPGPTHNPSVIVMRQFTGINADVGTNGNTLVCNTCTFNTGVISSNSFAGVPLSAVVYCGLTETGDAGAPLYSLAPQRGSVITSIPSIHQINLTTPINCAQGANFEIRIKRGPPGGVKIFAWANTPYDVWKRFGNFIGADSIMWQAGSGSPHCCDQATNPAYRRENGLFLLSCHRAINVLHDLSLTGGTTALAPIPACQSPAAAVHIPYASFAMIENMTGANYGRGTSIGSFLDGVLGYALIDWWQDPYMGVIGDPQFPFWTNRLTNALWAYYSTRNSYGAWCQPSHPHEWAYLMEDAIIGSCPQTNGNYFIQFADGTRHPVADYWSVAGNMLPLFAFFYQYTGNATIPPVGGMARPPWQPCYPLGQGTGVPACGSITYGAAYQDMASWIFVHMASLPAWAGFSGAKTLGEMGLWQDRAIGWMGGNGGSPPSTLSIVTSSLPNAQINAAYNASMAASGGTPPYAWNANVFPAGLTMNSSGVISGIPTAYGTTNITFTVTDSATPTPGTATITIPLTVTSTVPISLYPAYLTGVIP